MNYNLLFFSINSNFYIRNKKKNLKSVFMDNNCDTYTSESLEWVCERGAVSLIMKAMIYY